MSTNNNGSIKIKKTNLIAVQNYYFLKRYFYAK